MIHSNENPLSPLIRAMPDERWRVEGYWNRVIVPAIMKRSAVKLGGNKGPEGFHGFPFNH
jgi:hypothetical protein